jgi:transposase InsO family protein
MAEPSDRQDGFSVEYIEGFYNTRRRRHSALGHLSPSEYEEVRLRGGAVA